MIRFFLACVFYSAVAHWGYSEFSLMFPDLVPYLNRAINKVQIPTHNHWSRESIHEGLDSLSDSIEQASEAVTDVTDFMKARIKGGGSTGTDH